MNEQDLRGQLRSAFKNRALLYYLIYDELRQELGAERAERVLLRAIYRRGTQIGEPFRKFAPADFAGLREAFLAIIPDSGRMFDPQVTRCDAAGLDIQLEACPLKEAWQELDLTEADLATMCRIAGEIDRGTFEGAGFAFTPDTWQPGRTGCCHLQIRRRDAAEQRT